MTINLARFVFCLTALVLALLYWQGLSGPFILDDMNNLKPLARMDNGTTIDAIVMNNHSGMLGRPVSMLSFALNYLYFGFDPFYFKLTNLIIHLLIGSIIFSLTQLIFGRTIYRKFNVEMALVVSIFWLIAPLFSSTVLYTVQRMAQLSALFLLLGCYFYCKGRLALAEGNARLYWQWLAATLFIAWPLGLLSKENAIVLPFLLLVIEIFFMPLEKGRYEKKVITITFAFITVFPAFFALLALALFPERFLNYSGMDFTITERLLSQTRILWDYVNMLLLPVSTNFGVYHDDVVKSVSLTQPFTTLIAVAGWVLFLVFAISTYKYASIRLLSGGLCFFLVGHSVESSIFPLELYFEHRNYLPAVGVFWSLVVAWVLIVEHWNIRPRVSYVSFGLYFLIFSIALFQRVKAWESWETLIYTSFEHHPNSPRLLTEAALLDIRGGRLEEAESKLHRSLELKPSGSAGVMVQRAYNHCLVRSAGINSTFIDTDSWMSLSAGAYSSTALNELNTLAIKSGCGDFDYPLFAQSMYEWVARLYQRNDLRQDSLLVSQLRNNWTFQLRIAEALVYTGAYDEAITLINYWESIGQKNVAMLLTKASAAISLNNRNYVDQIMSQLNELDGSPSHQFHEAQIAELKSLYNKTFLKINETALD